MGLVTLTFDRLNFKLVCKSHLREGTFLPNLGMLGLWILELFAMCVTDGPTDRRTDGRMNKRNAYCLLPYGGITIIQYFYTSAEAEVMRSGQFRCHFECSNSNNSDL